MAFNTRSKNIHTESEMQDSSSASQSNAPVLGMTSKFNMKEMIECGKALGMEGQELRDFVEKERTLFVEKEEDERKRREGEERRREELEREETRRREGEERRREELEREKRDHELRIEQLRLESQTLQRNANNNASVRSSTTDDHFKPKIPCLSDKDDIESWFVQFEHYAKDCDLNEDQKASRLIYFLSGKARVIYSKLHPDDARNYNTLKSALYEGFQLTAEEYRKKFRFTKRAIGDTYKEYVTKLERYLDKWVELDLADRISEKSLKDMILREQFLNSLPADLSVHIKDRKLNDAKTMGEVATEYELNRNHRVNKKPVQTENPESRKTFERGQKLSEDEKKKLKEEGACFSCKNKGHIASSPLCPKRKNQYVKGNSVKVEENNFEMAESLDKLCTGCRDKNFKEKVLVKVNGKITPALRDSGCTGIIVSSDLVSENAYLDETKIVTFADRGTQENCHVAIVHVDSPYFEGPTEVTVMTNPIVPVLIGKWYGIHGKRQRTPIYPVRDPSWYQDSLADRLQNSEKDSTSTQGRTDRETDKRAGEFKQDTNSKPFQEDANGRKKSDATQENQVSVNNASKEISISQSDDKAAAVTRSMNEPKTKGNKTQIAESSTNKNEASMIYSPQELKKEQREDESLKQFHELAENQGSKGNSTFKYMKDILYRVAVDKEGNEYTRLVVPSKLREKVLHFGHDHPMAGHLGQKKTTDRIRSEFWWPGFCGDIKRYCASCDRCQRCTPKGKTKKVPLGKMPTVTPAFRKTAIDLIGPIKPASKSKKQYVLVIIDYSTRYPEAMAIKDITAEAVADGLWEFWTRLGIPDEVLTDQGSQFTSTLMKEVNEFLLIKHKMTCPFSPQTNGLVEKFNDTLKQMIKRLALEQPDQWDTFIPALLFAYREAPQDSLGFSPFELLYGRTVKGPMQVLRQIWTDEDISGETKTTAEYVVDLRNKIEETCKIARENLAKASKRQAKYFNKKTANRSFEEGEKVLLLRPVKSNKLELTWKGPYTVTKKVSPFDYQIQTERKLKIYHVNLMKKYVERSASKKQLTEVSETEEETQERVAVVVEPLEETETGEWQAHQYKDIPLVETKQTEDVSDIHIFEGLSEQQKQEAEEICKTGKTCWTDVPRTTNLIRCGIKVTEKNPVFIKPRGIPHALVGNIEKEISEMLRLGVIEPAESPYNSPIVLIKKKDQTYRFCADLRGLNDVIEPDHEPVSDVEHLFQSLGKAKYFSKIDLTKGYWAIPINEEDRDKTAFITSKGQFRWVNMPFGLKTASGVFNRMMRKLLGPLKRDDVHHFMDDILIATETWEEHKEALRAVIRRLEEANLAAKPSKCYIGYDQLPYLGHEIGRGARWPEKEKVEKISNSKPPATKKEMRSFLGLTGFYRSYIPNYAQITAPLSDMTKKEKPEKLKWSEQETNSFRRLKQALCENPVLRMPDYEKQFVLRTDASDRGIGAVLLQEHENKLHPIAYQSRKLQNAELNYSVVEKECLATVWGVQKFERYLYGKHFILETDHQPLKFLQRNPSNPRLMRWSLQLQPYDFHVRVIPGKDNHGADYLSRAIY